jgi:hypothetical protein
MNQLRSQAHVAQQSRREKLRVQQNPSSPQIGTQTDTSGFSNYILQQAPQSVITTEAHNQTRSRDSSRGYPGHPTHANTGDEMPMYDAGMLSSEMYNFPTGAELLGVPLKGIVLQQASSEDESNHPSAMGAVSYSSFGHSNSNFSGSKTNIVPNSGN